MGEKEGVREREKHQCGRDTSTSCHPQNPNWGQGQTAIEREQRLWAASCMPPTGDQAHNSGMCVDWESNWDISRSPWDDAQSSEPHWLGLCVPLCRCRNGSPEKLTSWYKVTQLLRGKARIHAQTSASSFVPAPRGLWNGPPSAN
uniref:Uncharacterized protein n=1 Tax=Molossus molossus TaxID=27622 RepID=A0A7J8BM84_MOLMO|nr:hypothetical protein HJG59_010103 [Molossus molossus]